MSRVISELEVGAAEARSAEIGNATLLRILWRSFFLGSATNHERMQNVGFAYGIMPALTKLHSGEDLKRAMARHLEFFNSHPYMALAVLGAAVRLEMEVAAGQRSPEQVRSFKSCMMGPMAAIGDSFFWASLKPFVAALAVAGVFSHVLWAPLVFLLLYNLFHITVRVHGLWAGFRMGERVVEKIHRIDLVRHADRSHYLAGICLGVGAALLVDAAARASFRLGDGLEALLLTAGVLVLFQCIRRRIPMWVLLYGASALTILVVTGLNCLFPLF